MIRILLAKGMDMGHKSNSRFHVSDDALSILRREGIGWAHDMETRTFRAGPVEHRPGAVAKLWNRVRGGL